MEYSESVPHTNADPSLGRRLAAMIGHPALADAVSGVGLLDRDVRFGAAIFLKETYFQVDPLDAFAGLLRFLRAMAKASSSGHSPIDATHLFACAEVFAGVRLWSPNRFHEIDDRLPALLELPLLDMWRGPIFFGHRDVIADALAGTSSPIPASLKIADVLALQLHHAGIASHDFFR